MSDLVGTPEDQFFHVTAQNGSELMAKNFILGGTGLAISSDTKQSIVHLYF